MRRLRDRLIAATVPLIILLLAVTWLVQDALLGQLSKQAAESVSSAYEYVDAIMTTRGPALLGQARQINDSAAMREALTTYIEAIQKCDEVRATGASRQQIADADEMLAAARSSLREDVGPTEVRNAGLELLVLIDLKGRVLASFRSPDGRPTSVVGDHTDEDGARPMIDEPVVQALVSGKARQAISYLVYRDGHLYLAAATPLMRGGETEGVLLLGTRRFIPPAGDLRIAYVSGGEVLDPQPSIDATRDEKTGLPPLSSKALADLTAWLSRWTPPAAAPPRPSSPPPSLPLVTLHLEDRAYLTLPHPLWETGREGPVAWALLMLPTDTVLEPVRESRRRVAAAGAAVLALSAILVVVMATRITRPIEDLSRKMAQVGSGDLDVVAPVKGRDEVAALAGAFNTMVDGLREKALLAAYVPEKARNAIADVKGRHAVGAKRVKATVLFSDLRGFTPLSEGLDPTDVVALLNEYLEQMQRVIRRHNGYISDYIGDAILAVFTNDDGESEECAVRGVRCALEMQAGLRRLRQTSANTQLQGLRMGIGLNTGALVEGDMGPTDRLKYAVIGDTVNTASRIQDRSKEGRHTCILIGASTKEDLGEQFETAFFGEEMLKGKTAPVPIWELVEREETGDSAASGTPADKAQEPPLA